MATSEPTAAAPDATEQDAPKSAIPPLSPTGKVVRRVLVCASWLTPVVWCTAIWLGKHLDGYASQGLLQILALIAGIYLPVLLVGWVWYVAAFRLRASLLELLLVLSTISVGPGLALGDAGERGMGDLSRLIWPLVLFFGSACWIGGGALWGLSVAQRTSEERTWPRLGYVLLGCGMLAGFVAMAAFAIALCWLLICVVGGAGEWGPPLILLGITLPLVVVAAWGLIIERRCRQKYGPVNL